MMLHPKRKIQQISSTSAEDLEDILLHFIVENKIPFSEEEIAIASPEELGKLIRNLKAKISPSELETINQKLAASLRSTPNCKEALRFHICKLRMIVATKE